MNRSFEETYAIGVGTKGKGCKNYLSSCGKCQSSTFSMLYGGQVMRYPALGGAPVPKGSMKLFPYAFCIEISIK